MLFYTIRYTTDYATRLYNTVSAGFLHPKRTRWKHRDVSRDVFPCWRAPAVRTTRVVRKAVPIHFTARRLPVLTWLKKRSGALGRDFIARPNDVFRPHGLRAYPDPLAWTYTYAVSNVSCWDDSVSRVTAKDASLSRFNVLLWIQTFRHFKIVNLWTVYVGRLVYHTSV